MFAAVIGALALVAASGYAVYRLRIRSAMHQEIRDIMAQVRHPACCCSPDSAGGQRCRLSAASTASLVCAADHCLQKHMLGMLWGLSTQCTCSSRLVVELKLNAGLCGAVHAPGVEREGGAAEQCAGKFQHSRAPKAR